MDTEKLTNKQISFNNIPNPRCPFTELLDKDDTHCYEIFKQYNYEVISENHPDFIPWLSRIGGVGIDNLQANPTPETDLPNFIPVLPKGSGVITQGNNLPFVGVDLQEIVSLYRKGTLTDIRKYLKVSPETKVILFNYAKDQPIEEIWPNKSQFYSWISGLNVDLATSINYSIWQDHPHAERLINLKRNILTFIKMQEYGIPAVPHLYWSGLHDIDRLAKWLNTNSVVKMVAFNMQTLRQKSSWKVYINDLAYFAQKVRKDIHYIVSGPSTLVKIRNVKNILHDVTFANTNCALKALSRRNLLKKDGNRESYDRRDKCEIFADNIRSYENSIKGIF